MKKTLKSDQIHEVSGAQPASRRSGVAIKEVLCDSLQISKIKYSLKSKTVLRHTLETTVLVLIKLRKKEEKQVYKLYNCSK